VVWAGALINCRYPLSLIELFSNEIIKVDKIPEEKPKGIVTTDTPIPDKSKGVTSSDTLHCNTTGLLVKSFLFALYLRFAMRLSSL